MVGPYKKIKDNVMPIVGAIRRCECISPRAANVIYNSHILSHISKTSETSIARLTIKSLKVLYNYHHRTSTALIYQETDNLHLDKLIFQCNVLFVHRNVHGNLKSGSVFIKKL